MFQKPCTSAKLVFRSLQVSLARDRVRTLTSHLRVTDEVKHACLMLCSGRRKQLEVQPKHECICIAELQREQPYCFAWQLGKQANRPPGGCRCSFVTQLKQINKPNKRKKIFIATMTRWMILVTFGTLGRGAASFWAMRARCGTHLCYNTITEKKKSLITSAHTTTSTVHHFRVSPF